MEQRELSHTAGVSENKYNPFAKNVWQYLLKLNVFKDYEAEIALLGICPTEVHA